MNKKNDSYNVIFKSTLLFGVVQIVNILAKVGVNKAAAVFLGVEGIGIIGLYQSTINILKTGFDLGLSQSVVRDISEGANSSPEKYHKAIVVSKKLVFLASLIGAIATLLLAPLLSKWTFGTNDHTFPFMWISIVVFLNIITEGRLAILKGARLLRALAKASLYSSLVGLITGIPLYYFLGIKGIIPSLIVVAATATIFSWYFVIQIKCPRISVSISSALREGRGMIKMGIALMYVNFLVVLADYLIRTYISNIASLEMVGFYQAGAMITSSYFGIIVTALITDYYPRISAINKDNKKIEVEFNKQSEVGLLMIGPLVLVFLFALPLFVRILYTSTFLPIISYLEYAALGVILTMCSNAMGFIMLAKQDVKVFFITATLGRIIIVSISILLFNSMGLKGLGIAALLAAIFHILFMQIVMWKRYDILMSKRLLGLLIVMLSIAVLSFLFKDIQNLPLRYTLGGLLLIFSIYYSIWKAKKNMGLDLISYIKRKISR